ncbi:MAG: hypothetical protein ACPG3T_02815 [Pseudomonadales bacterium]
MSEWKSILGGLAPTIATVMGGPAAGTAVGFITKKLLGKDGGSKEDLEKFILGASPEDLAKIKSAEHEFKLKLKELEISESELVVKDRDSARALASSKGIEPHVWLSGIFIIGFFALLWVLFSGTIELNQSLRDPVLILVGVVGTNVTLIMKFWFGGSPNDTQHIENMYRAYPGDKK